MKRVSHYWQTRQPRERVLLTICAAVAVIAVLYLVRERALSWQQQRAAQLSLNQQQLQQMQLLEPRIQAALKRQPVPATEPTLQLPEGLTLQRSADGSWRATPADVTFPALLNALMQLEERYALQPRYLRLERQEDKLRLQRLELADDR